LSAEVACRQRWLVGRGGLSVVGTRGSSEFRIDPTIYIEPGPMGIGLAGFNTILFTDLPFAVVTI
jgi:hypothetical protein